MADEHGQRNNSMLTFEKEPFQGTQSILEKLTVSGLGWTDPDVRDVIQKLMDVW